MRTGSGRTAGLTDVVCAQQEPYEDHPSNCRYAWVDTFCSFLSLASTVLFLRVKGKKKKTGVRVQHFFFLKKSGGGNIPRAFLEMACPAPEKRLLDTAVVV